MSESNMVGALSVGCSPTCPAGGNVIGDNPYTEKQLEGAVLISSYTTSSKMKPQHSARGKQDNITVRTKKQEQKREQDKAFKKEWKLDKPKGTIVEKEGDWKKEGYIPDGIVSNKADSYLQFCSIMEDTEYNPNIAGEDTSDREHKDYSDSAGKNIAREHGMMSHYHTSYNEFLEIGVL